MWPFTRPRLHARLATRTPSDDDTIIGRIVALLRANIHTALEQAEEPEKALDQLVSDFTAAIKDARHAVQQTIAINRLVESQQHDDVAAIREWGDKAALAAARTRTFQTKGDAAGATRAQKLARTALQKQIAAEKRFSDRASLIEQQNDVIDNLKDGLAMMDDKLEVLKERRNELRSRHLLARAQENVLDTIGRIDSGDSTNALARLEGAVRRQEALVIGKLEVAQSSVEHQFDDLAALDTHDETERRLASLLRGRDRRGQVGS